MIFMSIAQNPIDVIYLAIYARKIKRTSKFVEVLIVPLKEGIQIVGSIWSKQCIREELDKNIVGEVFVAPTLPHFAFIGESVVAVKQNQEQFPHISGMGILIEYLVVIYHG